MHIERPSKLVEENISRSPQVLNSIVFPIIIYIYTYTYTYST